MRQYEIFYKKAKTDFAMAQVAKNSHNKDIDNEAILFHLQQSVEKLLKALLAFHDISVEKTHDIEMIGKKCRSIKLPLPEFVEQLYDLSEYAVEGRYGQIHDDVENIDIYFELIEKLIEFTANILQSKPEGGIE